MQLLVCSEVLLAWVPAMQTSLAVFPLNSMQDDHMPSMSSLLSPHTFSFPFRPVGLQPKSTAVNEVFALISIHGTHGLYFYLNN